MHIESGDLNGDGFDDLAAVNKGTDTLSVFLYNPQISTFEQTDYPSISRAQSVAFGDFNLDGTSEIVVSGTSFTDPAQYL